jgi:hypothetical protein
MKFLYTNFEDEQQKKLSNIVYIILPDRESIIVSETNLYTERERERGRLILFK